MRTTPAGAPDAVRAPAALALVLALALAATLHSPPACANNGLSAIGFGTESVAMGGADTAVARDTTAVNTNPAGLAQSSRMALDVFAAAGHALDVAHSDAYGNHRRSGNRTTPYGGFGFSRELPGGRVVAALGVFVQGGAGARYDAVHTPFGGIDDLSSTVGVVRLTPGLAWRVNERLSLGVAVPINAIVADEAVFPHSSVFDPAAPARSFFGLDLKHASGVRAGLRLGVMWKPADGWTFGATLAPRVRLDASGGEAQVDFSAAGLGRVTYRRAALRGFALPREIALGAAWQVTPSTLLSLKLAQLAWSAAMRNASVVLDDPSQPAAPAHLAQSAALDWRDQTVVALGVAVAVNDRLSLLAGFNHARNPIPARTLSPLLAAIGERHATAGFAWRADPDWSLAGSLEYQFGQKLAYTNPDAPLGLGAEERTRYVVLQLMLGRRW